MKLENEQQLLKQIADGDHAAFGKLVKELGPYLHTKVLQISESPELAEEVVQDIFVQIWQTREVLATIRNIYGYLFVVSRNHLLDILRKQARERRNKQKWTEDQRLAMVETEPSSELFNILDQAINALPPQQQKVWVMSRRLRMKYDEIARELSISKDAVNKYLQAANRNIVKWVREHEGLLLFLFLLLKKII